MTQSVLGDAVVHNHIVDMESPVGKEAGTVDVVVTAATAGVAEDRLT